MDLQSGGRGVPGSEAPPSEWHTVVAVGSRRSRSSCDPGAWVLGPGEWEENVQGGSLRGPLLPAFSKSLERALGSKEVQVGPLGGVSVYSPTPRRGCSLGGGWKCPEEEAGQEGTSSAWVSPKQLLTWGTPPTGTGTPSATAASLGPCGRHRHRQDGNRKGT